MIQKYLLFIFLLTFKFLSFANDNYARAYFNNLAMFTPSYDFRYINELEIKKDYQALNKANEQLLKYEAASKISDLHAIYKYVITERKFIRSENLNYLYDDAFDLYSNLKGTLINNKSLNNLLPLSISYGSHYSINNALMSRSKIGSLLSEYIDENSIFSPLIKNKDNYFLEITNLQLNNDSNPNKLIISFIKIEGSIFTYMNTKYELSNVYFSYWDIGDEEIDINKISSTELSTIKKFTYGIQETHLPVEINENYIVTTSNIKLYEDIYSMNIIKELELNTIFKVIDIGEFAIIDDIGANWIKIKLSDGLSGWCLGSDSFIRYWPEY